MIIGIDAGGTHTRASLFLADGKVIDSVAIDSVHPLQVGYQTCGKRLAHLIVSLCEKNGIHPCAVSAGIGLAGYGEDQAIRSQIEEALTCYLPCAYTLTNDVQIALYGALAGEDGIVIVAGTGSIAFAKKGSICYRCGGFGHRIGDEGSAYWIGKRLLEIFSKQCDGRLEHSKLHAIICTALQLTGNYEIISYLELHHKRSEIAKLAKLVYQAAIKRDQYALAIYDEAAYELATLANVLKCNYHTPIKVSYYGGVFKSGDYLVKPLKNYLDEGLQIIPPIYDPVKGAYILRCKEIECCNN